MENNIIAIEPLGFPWETQDPFLFCAYHNDAYPKGNGEMGLTDQDKQGRRVGQDFSAKDGFSMYHGQNVPGFPYHPHRGFETITINKKGVVDHSDSLGAAGRFMAGDVQWMTAGKGIQHSEMFPLLNADKSNDLEIFQVWLNLPKVSKFVEPHFKMLWREDVPVITQKNEMGNATVVDLIAGNIDGEKALAPTPNSWAANPEHKVRVLTVKIEANSDWALNETSEKANRSIYFYQGKDLVVDTIRVDADHHIKLKPNATIQFKNESLVDAYLLVLEGVPIGEPVVQYGPFVMNTKQEIQQAIADYQKTQFGGWPWKEREKTHHSSKGRFALHANGVEEEK